MRTRDRLPEAFAFSEAPGIVVVSAREGRPWSDTDDEEVDGMVQDWWGQVTQTHSPHTIQGAGLALLLPRSGSVFDKAAQPRVPEWLRGRERVTGKWDFVMVTTPKLRGGTPRRAVAVATIERRGRHIPVGLAAPEVGTGGMPVFLEDAAERLMARGLEDVPSEPEWMSWMTTGEMLPLDDIRLWRTGAYWKDDEF